MFLTKLLSILSTFSFSVGLECGQFTNYNNLLTERIVNGDNANIGEFPWQVSMQKSARSAKVQWIPQPGTWPPHGTWGQAATGQWHTIPAIKVTPTPPGGWPTPPSRPVPYPPTHSPGETQNKPNPVNQRPTTVVPQLPPKPSPVTQPKPLPRPPVPQPQPSPRPPVPQPQPSPRPPVPQPQPHPPPSVTTGSWMHFCGGSIISENWILTAAHCVESLKYSYKPGQIRIVLGSLDWRNTNNGSPQIISIESITVHNGWDRGNGLNDIALLRTSTPIQFRAASDGTVLANKVCLSKDAITEYRGEAISSGWGYTSKDKRVSPDMLRKVKLPIVDFNTCRNAFSRVIEVTKNQVCAGQAPKGNCMGDSGGPLVQVNGNKATQIGIVSFSIPCAVPGYPDVFTKVSSYIDWINQQIGLAMG